MLNIIKQTDLTARYGNDVIFLETVVMIEFHEFIIVEKYCRSAGWAGTQWYGGSRKTFLDKERDKAEFWYSLLCDGQEWCLEDKLKEAFPN